MIRKIHLTEKDIQKIKMIAADCGIKLDTGKGFTISNSDGNPTQYKTHDAWFSQLLCTLMLQIYKPKQTHFGSAYDIRPVVVDGQGND